MSNADIWIDPGVALTSSEKFDERELNTSGLRMRNVRRALLDVTGFGRHNNGDTVQRSWLDGVQGRSLAEISTWLTNSLLNIATISWALGSPQHIGEILSGRVIIGAIIGLQREASYADTRKVVLREGIKGATKSEMKLFTDSPEKGGLLH